MSSLISRSAVLTLSRLSNFGILAISPLFLVRILEVEAFGQYQEFMIWAMLLVTVCGFSVDSSLTYFLPKYESDARILVSQASALILFFSTLCIAILLAAQPLYEKATSYNFAAPLAAYVFCFVNLNWLEYYWIVRRRTDLVLYYSLARVFARVTTLLMVAYFTRDLQSILWSLVVVEAARVLIVAACMLRFRMFCVDWRRSYLAEQLRYSAPLGTGTLVQQASHSMGKLFVASTLGPVAVAYYAVGSYLVPFVKVIKSSIANVVFPELVRAGNDLDSVLALWQRMNVMFCVLLFPAFTALVFYSELIVSTLFTEAYLAAVPIFQVYLLWILRRCFNLDVLLRTRSKTGYVLIGTIMALTINLILMLVLYRHFGLIGPAMAFIAAEIILELFYAKCVMKEFGLRMATLIDWKGVWRVAVGCFAGLPVLVLSRHAPLPEILSGAAASMIFVLTCWFVAYRLGVNDIGRLAHFGASLLTRMPRRSSGAA